LVDAEDALEALRNAKRPQSAGEQLIAALASGEGCDVSALTRPAADAAERERVLVVEIETWSRATDDCKIRIAELENSLRYKETSVDNCAGAVLTECGAIEKLFAGFPEMVAEVNARRAAIWWFTHNARLSFEERKALETRHGKLFDVDFKMHPDSREWSRALEALKGDADAVLPL
jgi:hypothetical protein